MTSFLITTPKGHILLDGGYKETAPQIEANVATLGFHLEDVKILLNSHAHLDHAGGLAELKQRRRTGWMSWRWMPSCSRVAGRMISISVTG